MEAEPGYTVRRLHFAAIGGLADTYLDTNGLRRNHVVFRITQLDRVTWPEFHDVEEIVLVYRGRIGMAGLDGGMYDSSP